MFISFVVPVHNEQKNIPLVYKELTDQLNELKHDYEIIFVDDGSTDRSAEQIAKLMKVDDSVKVIEFTRNFGKEIALTAGVNSCLGEACLILDGDLQHPIAQVPEFIDKWQKGAEVVVGVRKKNKGEGLIKKLGSAIYYKIINKISETEIVPRSTDFRLLDRAVIDAFKELSERNRMTRALIDWLGFKRDYVYFEANERAHGDAGYSFIKLMKLAFNSFVSLSLFPLRLAGYLGIFITLLSAILGVFIILERYILKDPLKMNFSGSAILAVITIFLVGVILICMGLIALYVANIHNEVIGRPMYVTRRNTLTDSQKDIETLKNEKEPMLIK